MKFAIAPVTYWDSIGFDTTEWRKSLDGTKAICHLEYAEKLGANLHANPQVQIIDSVDPNLKNILESSEWVIDGTNGDLDSFSFLTKLNQFETKVNDAVSEKVAINEQKVLSVESQLQQTEQSLNAQLDQTEKINSQIDLVDFVKDQTNHYNKMYFIKTEANKYQVRMNNQKKGVVYQFVKDNNDDFIKIDSCGVGLKDSIKTKINPYAGDTSDPLFSDGTFIASASHFYTTTIDDFIRFSVEGSKITMFANTESRGGLWEYVIDGTISGEVSLYNTDTVTKTFVLAENLEPEIEHNVVLTFKGDDPQNPPSSSPSRGYVSRTADENNGMFVGREISGSLDTVILADASNKEFAFNVSKNGSGNWIPEHNAVGSTFAVEQPTVSIDERTYNLSDLEVGKLYTASAIEIIQNLRGEVVGQGNVMNLKTSHKLNQNGILSFAGSFVALTAFKITGYPVMLPSLSVNAKDFYTGILNNKTSVGDESYHYFNEEENDVYSGAVVDSVNTNLIGASVIKTPTKTYRKGKPGTAAEGEQLFLWQRSTKPKMYWQSFKDTDFFTNDVYGWSFDFIVSDIDNIYNMIKS